MDKSLSNATGAWVLDPDQDPDRFYIKVIDPTQRGKHPKVRLWTTHKLVDSLATGLGVRNANDYEDNAPGKNLITLDDDPNDANIMTNKQADFGNHISSDKRFNWTQQQTIYTNTMRIKKP